MKVVRANTVMTDHDGLPSNNISTIDLKVS